MVQIKKPFNLPCSIYKSIFYNLQFLSTFSLHQNEPMYSNLDTHPYRVVGVGTGPPDAESRNILSNNFPGMSEKKVERASQTHCTISNVRHFPQEYQTYLNPKCRSGRSFPNNFCTLQAIPFVILRPLTVPAPRISVLV